MELSAAQVRRLETEADLRAAWPVVVQLRPHLDVETLLAAVAAQRAEHYRCIGLFRGDACLGFAGYRIQHMLAHGRFLYVDDLVTDVEVRGQGIGGVLLDWLEAEARQAGCAGLQLDSGTQRLEAHAFYFGRSLRVTSFHFARKF